MKWLKIHVDEIYADHWMSFPRLPFRDVNIDN